MTDVEVIGALKNHWRELSNDKYELNEAGVNTLWRFFSRYELPLQTIVEAMRFAAEKCPEDKPEDRFKYFCGICWHKIRSGHEPYTKPVEKAKL